MHKGEIVINFYFTRVFFAYAIGRDKRHTTRQKNGSRVDALIVVLAFLSISFLLAGLTWLFLNSSLIAGVETPVR